LHGRHPGYPNPIQEPCIPRLAQVAFLYPVLKLLHVVAIPPLASGKATACIAQKLRKRELVDKTSDSRVSVLEGVHRPQWTEWPIDHALDIASGILLRATLELFGISAAVGVYPR